ncbi:Uncharacterised protein [Neisseria animalis]|nr:Uncharacterised protein [Neisseria animalis]
MTEKTPLDKAQAKYESTARLKKNSILQPQYR